MSLRFVAEWLDSTAWSTALHESLYMYPLIETTHVLSLMFFVGTIAVVDLRMLGLVFNQVPISTITRRILPYTLFGFVVIVTTGLLLFYAIPIRTYHSIWFRVKVVMIVLAGFNAWHYHTRIERDNYNWDDLPKPPWRVRATAAFSLFAWVCVIFTGRMIAYNWFDCDKPQPAWVVTMAGCVIDELETL